MDDLHSQLADAYRQLREAEERTNNLTAGVERMEYEKTDLMDQVQTLRDELHKTKAFYQQAIVDLQREKDS